MEIFLIGLLAGLVWIWLHKASKRDESLYRAGRDARKCPYCAEWVKREAVVCRYCHKDLPLVGPWEQIKPAPKTQYGTTRKEMKVLGVILFAIVVVGLLMLASGNLRIRNRGYESNSVAVEACVSRGRAYFTEIGSFPTLSDGRDALTVARERCRRAITAF